MDTSGLLKGMDKGYEESLMGRLHKEYPITNFLACVTRVSAELQEFLRQAANMVPGRTSHFVVDPEDSCLPVLNGAQDLNQLEAAWELLRSRLELGHRFFLKYVEEFKDKEAAPSSLASTVAALHQELKGGKSPLERIKTMYLDFPHHNSNLSVDDRRSLTFSGRWDQIATVAADVKDTFPRRLPEDNPFVLQYNPGGQAIKMIPPSEHPSYPVGDDSNVTRRGGSSARLVIPLSTQDSRILDEQDTRSRELDAKREDLERREQAFRLAQEEWDKSRSFQQEFKEKKARKGLARDEDELSYVGGTSFREDTAFLAPNTIYKEPGSFFEDFNYFHAFYDSTSSSSSISTTFALEWPRRWTAFSVVTARINPVFSFWNSLRDFGAHLRGGDFVGYAEEYGAIGKTADGVNALDIVVLPGLSSSL
ncbi:hypothetical protein R3P38DRAFT_2798465 [Favolaschia claudopus]|uniref:Uncharacterized protein n=1 Tax=Favolaschia claudopus TaxID=2862362 RepID=A0AAW0A2L2_9AGAR